MSIEDFIIKFSCKCLPILTFFFFPLNRYSCLCPEGMELNEDKTCRDINECEQDSPCEQICENTEGRSAMRFFFIGR